MSNKDTQMLPPPPPPPPPPSLSPRYLLTVPESVTDVSKLGIQFIPFHESHSNASRSIGAKISLIHSERKREGGADDDGTLQVWIKQYNMKSGDVLVKLNNDVVKTRSFKSTMSRLDLLLRSKQGVSLTLERSDGYEDKFECPKQPVTELNAVQSSFTQHFVDRKDCSSLSIDLSHEHNVLHSIFSTKKTQIIKKGPKEDSSDYPTAVVEISSQLDNSISSNSSSSSSSALPPPLRGALERKEPLEEKKACNDYDLLSNDSIGYDLSAIPEESDIFREVDSTRQAMRSPSKPQPQSYLSHSQQLHEQTHQKVLLPSNNLARSCNIDHHKSPPFKTIYRLSNSTISNDFSSSHLGSPSFSYSDSECLISPVGTRIPIFDVNGTKSIESQGLLSQSIRRKTMTSKKTHHTNDKQDKNDTNNQEEKIEVTSKHLRSAYLSPESEHANSTNNVPDSPLHRCKSVKFSSHLLKSSNDQSKCYSEFHTPNSDNHLKMKTITHFQSPVSEIYPTSSVESCSVSTVYLSPLPSLGLGAGKSLPKHSTIMRVGQRDSPGSFSSCNSFNDVPIHMLDYQYVRECRSYEELEKIVQALSTSKKGQKQQFPSLLRLAKNKLNGLTTTKHRNGNHRTEINARETNKNNNVMTEEINYSGIPSHIHFEIRGEEGGYCSHNSLVGAISSKTSGTCSLNEHESHHDEELVENMNSIVIAHAELKNKMEIVLDEREIMRKRLTDKIHGLQTTCNELNNYAQLQAVKYNQKIDCLLDSKRRTEGEMKKLEETVVSSSKEARQVMNQLDVCKNEVRKLKLELELRNESKRSQEEKAQFIQSQLVAKVANLTKQVELHDEDNKASRELIELELRSEYQAASQIEMARINELEKYLSHTREELRRVYRENEAISEEFAKAGKVSLSPHN